MRAKLFIIMLFINTIILGYSVYAQNENSSKCDDAIYVKTDAYEGIIWGINCPENIIDDKNYRWAPTEEDIKNAEKLIKEYIVKSVKEKGLLNQQYDDNAPIIHLNLDKYYRQYLGYKGEQGKKIIFVNCFWKEKEALFPYWKRDQIAVFDGGSYYWSIFVDMERNMCFDYFVHGR